MTKFTENDHEKVDRLLELHFKYLDKVELIDQEVENMEKVSIYMLTLFTFHKFCKIFQSIITGYQYNCIELTINEI